MACPLLQKRAVKLQVWNWLIALTLLTGAPETFAKKHKPPKPPKLDAAFVTQSVPASMIPGHSYSVNVTMQNPGAKVWSGTAQLGPQNPPNNQPWEIPRINAPGNISPGQNAFFIFSVTPPATPGNYN